MVHDGWVEGDAVRSQDGGPQFQAEAVRGQRDVEVRRQLSHALQHGVRAFQVLGIMWQAAPPDEQEGVELGAAFARDPHVLPVALEQIADFCRDVSVATHQGIPVPPKQRICNSPAVWRVFVPRVVQHSEEQEREFPNALHNPGRPTRQRPQPERHNERSGAGLGAIRK
eukprot:4090601-Pyramimonas_sp.AAC.1